MKPTAPIAASVADRILVERAVDGDAAAFRELIRRHSSLMRAYVYRIVGSMADTDDVVQDAFVIAWKKLPTLRDASAVTACGSTGPERVEATNELHQPCAEPHRAVLIGLLFFALGGVVVVISAWPAAAEVWTAAGEQADGWLAQAVETTTVAGTTLSWIALGAVAAIVVVIVLLVLALTSVSGRRSRTVLRSTGAQNPLGRVTVTEAFVSDAITQALAGQDDILASSVTANTIRDEPVLHVRVTPRQNTSPREVVDRVDRLISNVVTLTGQETAAYISIHSGLRARLAHDRSRLS